MKKCFFGLVAAGVLAASANAQMTSAEMEAPIAKVTAVVSELWDKSKPEYKSQLWEKDLKGLSGAPGFDEFMANEQWLVVVSNRSWAYPGIFRGSSLVADKVAVGDIVEMRVLSSFKTPKAYTELGMVTKVLCRKSEPNYSECAKGNPLSWFDKDGAPLKQPGKRKDSQ